MTLALNCHKIWFAKAFGFLYRKYFIRKLFPLQIPLVSILFMLSDSNSHAQERCGIIEYQEYLKSKGIIIETNSEFEDWLIKKKNERNLNQKLGVEKITQDIYTIPIVVHVIHNDEPIGSGANISDQQIQSQIEVLNEDFRRQNLDAILTLAEFVPVASDPEIEFVLAKQDPDGLATNGITRSKGSQASYTFADAELLKNQSYWPSEDYLNIWVANLSPGSLGLASFPVTDLEGIENPELNRLYDGVVVAYDVFGSQDKDPNADLLNNFDKGRTTTHEIGHFLGLRHISGDGNCSVDDFCLDTPNQNGQTNGCPASRNTCGSNDMYQNYLDYTDDRCMNIFTMCQKDRMRTVLENSPRRLSLLTSPGLEEPVPINADIAISEIHAPSTGECTQLITPSLQLRNAGTDVITEAIIKVSANNIELETRTFNLNLASAASTDVTFNQIQTQSKGYFTFDFEVQSVNGVQDLNTLNNSKSINTFISFDLSLPTIETFDAFPVSWNLINPDESITWELSNAPSISSSNTAAKINFYDYENGLGLEDYLITPLIDLSGSTTASLIFDRAYAIYPGSESDNLTIAVSLDCGTTFPFKVYNRNSISLQTATPTPLPFIPTSANEWQKDIVDLSAFAGLTDLQIAFIATNGFGNNLYLDNIKIIKSPIADISISRVTSPDEISCNISVSPTLLVTNSGTVTINNLSASIKSNGVEISAKDFGSLNLTAGNQRTLILDPINLEPGNNQLTFEVKLLAGTTDFNPDDNALDGNFVLVTESEFIPLRQKFKEPGNIGNWIIANSGAGEQSWKVEEAFSQSLNNYAASVKAWSNQTVGSRSVLISPVLNFFLVRESSMFFRVSYASRIDKNDILRIKASTDCGNNFEVIYEKGSQDLGIRQSESEWYPQSELDWINEYVDLTNFAGEQQVIFAFEFTDGGGNNLFLDDIEFFISNDPNPVLINSTWSVYPNPAVNGIFDITLNFDEKQKTEVRIINSTGQEMYRTTVINSLNQTVPVDLTTHPSGIYFVRLISKEVNETRTVIIKP